MSIASDRPTNSWDRSYFPELDGLRFFAFALVFVFHGGAPWITDALSWITIPLFLLASPFGDEAASRAVAIGPGVYKALSNNGWVGVQLFFTLSGFLITTLLLREEQRFGRIDLKAFWMRRILRIWPLYYLIVFLTFFAIPRLGGVAAEPSHRDMIRTHLPWFLGFLGNWSMVSFGPVGEDSISILWSVCVEEQFYIVCPLVLVAVPARYRIGLVAALMAAAVWYRRNLALGNPDQYVLQYDAFAHCDTMFSGVLLALILQRYPPRAERRPRLKSLLPWATAIAVVAVLSRYRLAHDTVARRTWDFVAIWLCGVGGVASAALREGRLRSLLSRPILVWLGRISYGLYMYHEIALWARSKAIERAGFSSWSGSFSILSLFLTVGLAAASYYGYERYFLRFKKSWTKVPSRPVE